MSDNLSYSSKVRSTGRATSSDGPEFTRLGLLAPGLLQLPVEFARPRVIGSIGRSFLNVSHYNNTKSQFHQVKTIANLEAKLAPPPLAVRARNDDVESCRVKVSGVSGPWESYL